MKDCSGVSGQLSLPAFLLNPFFIVPWKKISVLPAIVLRQYTCWREL